MSVKYHELAPSNNASSFSQFDSIDFELQAPGRKLLKNSIMFEYKIGQSATPGTQTNGVVGGVALKTGSFAGPGNFGGLDHKVGYHGVCDSWTTTSAKLGMLENLNSYGRYVATISAATLDEGDMLNVFHQAEGKALTQDGGCYKLQPLRLRCKGTNAGAYTGIAKPLEACFMPKICLNSMVGDDYSFNTNGSIRLSTVLSRTNNFVFGKGCGDGSNYSIRDVKLKFMTVDDDGKQGPMMLNSVVSVKSAINSNAASLSFRVPAKSCNGVVMNFIQQNRENTAVDNSYALENLPNLNSLQMLFSSSTSQGISYEILDKGEMIKNGVKALSESGHSQVSATKIAVNNGLLIGQSFEDYLDLSSQPFSVNIQHDAPDISANPRLVYMYFLNLIEA